jgi:hypothetical protein
MLRLLQNRGMHRLDIQSLASTVDAYLQQYLRRSPAYQQAAQRYQQGPTALHPRYVDQYATTQAAQAWTPGQSFIGVGRAQAPEVISRQYAR